MSATPAMTEAIVGTPSEAMPRRSSAQTRQFREQISHVSRHSSIFFLGTIFTAAAGYVFKIYLARVLGAEALGIYTLGITIVGFVGVFNALGLPQAAVRFVATYSATGKLQRLGAFLISSTFLLLVLNLALATLMLLIGPAIAMRFYHTSDLVPYMGLLAAIMLLGGLNSFLGQVLAGYKDIIRRTVITNFICSPVSIGITVLLVTLGTGLWGYVFAQVASAAIVFVLLVVNVWKLTPREAFANVSGLARLEPEVISFSAAAFGMGFLEFVMSQGDKVLIGFYLNVRSVGIYAVSAALVTFIPILLQSVNQIFSPVIADLHARGERELLQRLFQTLTKWVLGLTLPLAISVILFAKPLMGMFGQAFEPGWPILVIGTAAQLVNCGVGSVGYLLLMSGQQHRLVRVQTVCAVLMLLLNFVLVPRWGITGAAVAAAATTVMANLMSLIEVRRSLRLSPYNRGYLGLAPPVLASSAIAFAIRVALPTAGPKWLVIVLTLSYLTFLGTAALCGLDADDRLIRRALMGRLQGKFWQAKYS